MEPQQLWGAVSLLDGVPLKSLGSIVTLEDQLSRVTSILLVVSCSLYDLLSFCSFISKLSPVRPSLGKGRNSCQISIRLFERATHERPHNIFDHHWDFIQECWSWEPGPRPEAEIALNRVQVMAAEYLWAIVDNVRLVCMRNLENVG